MMNDDIRHVRIFFTNGYGPMLSRPMPLSELLAATNGNAEHVFRLVEVCEWNELTEKLIELQAKSIPVADETKIAAMQAVIDAAYEVASSPADINLNKLRKALSQWENR